MLLPIFDPSGGTGSGAWYHVYGYAAFRSPATTSAAQYERASPKPCNGSDRCITGYFTRFVELSDAWTVQPDRAPARLLHPPTDPIGSAFS